VVQEIGEDWKVGRVLNYTEEMGKHKERKKVVVVRTKVRKEQCRGGTTSTRKEGCKIFQGR